MKLISVEPSDKKDKKFYATFDLGNKTKKVHFGQKGSSTYLDHKDDKKRDAYLARHKKALQARRYSNKIDFC